jgi:hypothetical protein
MHDEKRLGFADTGEHVLAPTTSVVHAAFIQG